MIPLNETNGRRCRRSPLMITNDAMQDIAAFTVRYEEGGNENIGIEDNSGHRVSYSRFPAGTRAPDRPRPLRFGFLA